ncbi:MAG TPA: hypothetical protein VFW71_12715 [Actinomycetota bacterium]|nr:hypothetical protein [Actinomycetota bacterium]
MSPEDNEAGSTPPEAQDATPDEMAGAGSSDAPEESADETAEVFVGEPDDGASEAFEDTEEAADADETEAGTAAGPAAGTVAGATAPAPGTTARPAGSGARPVSRPGAPRPGQPRGGRPVARTAQGRAVQAARASGTEPKTPPAPKPTPSKTPRPAGTAGNGPPRASKPAAAAADGDPARPRDARERRAKEIERRKAAAAAAAQAKRKRQIITFASSGIGAVALVVLIVILATGGGGTPATTKVTTTDIPTSTVLSSPPATSPGPETVPLPVGSVLAPINANLTGQSMDGITCGAESVVYHIHVHLTIFVDGVAKQVPYGVGIPNPQTSTANGAPFVNNGQCFYWLHTHAADGIIHVESPVSKTFSLGDFFDEWGQPLSMTQVGPASGPVTIYYNGKLYTGTDPRSIPLEKHGQIQIEVGTPLVAPVTVTSWANL